MTDETSLTRQADSLSSKLVYTDDVPLAWDMLTAPPSAGRLAVVHEENERLLRYLAAQDDFHHDTNDDEMAGLGSALARFEFKLNIIMDMVSQVLSSQLTLPEVASVRIGSADLCWQQAPGLVQPKVGDRLVVRVYLSHQFPRPLELYGSLKSDPDQAGADGMCLHYDPLPDFLRQLLEKMIFRQHRRLVSQRHTTARGGHEQT